MFLIILFEVMFKHQIFFNVSVFSLHGEIEVHTNPKRVIFLKLWNEWAEGMILEPSNIHGYRFLEGIKEVFGEI